MKITNEFTVHTPIERAWAVLTDLPGIAPCMPGAQLTGVDGDAYQGKVKVKVGPVISEFAGTARFTEKDDAGYRAVIDAKGRDARSAGNASALVTAVLTPAGSSTSVTVDTDLKISGKLAQFGSGMIKEVSGKLLAQFVANLEAKLATEDARPEAPSAPAASSAPADSAPDTSAPTAGASGSAAAASSAPTSSASGPAAPASSAPTAGASASAAPASSAPASGASGSAAPASSAPSASAQRSSSSAVAAPAVAAPAAFSPDSADETEPLDLLGVAGSSIYKRAIPVVVGVVVVGAVIAWVVARR